MSFLLSLLCLSNLTYFIILSSTISDFDDKRIRVFAALKKKGPSTSGTVALAPALKPIEKPAKEPTKSKEITVGQIPIG